jgi:hypothetical protein
MKKVVLKIYRLVICHLRIIVGRVVINAQQEKFC